MADKSDLDRTFEELGRLVRGTARLLVGSRVGGRNDEETVISSEVDAVVEGAVAVVGDWLKDFGEELQHNSGAVPEPVDEEGWSPLAVGAQAFGHGLMAVATELAGNFSEGEE